MEMECPKLTKMLVAVVLFLGLGSVVQAAGEKVRVFILAGQSNMEGHGRIRNLNHLGNHPQYGYLLNTLKNVTFVSTLDFWDTRLQELRVLADTYWHVKQEKEIKDSRDNVLPTKALNDEYWRLGGHWAGTVGTHSKRR
jgi:hypothetical protein